jgi:hypothetical protein
MFTRCMSKSNAHALVALAIQRLWTHRMILTLQVYDLLFTCLCAYLCIICNCIICNASLSYLRQDGTYSSSVSWLAHVSMHNSESYTCRVSIKDAPLPLLNVACWMLDVACCMLHVAWCMVHGAWCSACCMLHIKHQASRIKHQASSIKHHACWMLDVGCCMLHVACCMVHGQCMLHVAYQASSITHQSWNLLFKLRHTDFAKHQFVRPSHRFCYFGM